MITNLSASARGLVKRGACSLLVGVAALLLLPSLVLSSSLRIVSLGPYLTAEIYTLKAEGLLVGCTTYAPDKAASKPKVGGVVDVSVEGILFLNPTLVLATSLTRPGVVKRLKSLGIRVELFNQPRNFNEICQQFLRLARLLNREKRALVILKGIKTEVERIEAKLKGLEKVRVFVEIGARPLFTAHGHSFLSELVEMAGGINVARHASSGIYSREMVVRANPQVILIVTMGVVGQRELVKWREFFTIDAVKAGRVHVVDANTFCSPTPQNFLKALKITARLLHPGVEV